MAATDAVTLHTWDETPLETLSPLLDRRLITGEHVMLAHIHLKKGCVVPLHHHVNEQFSYVVDGALKFWIGSDICPRTSRTKPRRS